MPSTTPRLLGVLAMLGATLWAATCILVAFTADGTRDVLGFSERGWRTLLLNPAMLCFMAGLAGVHAKQAGRSGRSGKTGFVISLLGLATMIVGNVAEFWLFELFYGTQYPGTVIIGIGFMLVPVGLVLFGVGTLRAKELSGWRRVVPLSFGLVLVSLTLIGIAAMVVTGSGSQEELMVVMLLAIAIGWAVLGYALWSTKEKTDRYAGA